MESFEHVCAAEVWGHAVEIWWPIHPTSRVRVSETDIIHVQAHILARLTRFGEIEHLLENQLAYRDVNVTALLSDGFHANVDLLFELSGNCAAGFDKTFFVGEWEIREIMRCWVDPAIADEEAPKVPFGLGLGIAIEDGLCNVGDVLASVGFAGDVDLACVGSEHKL